MEGHHQYDVKHASAGNAKKGRPKKIWLDHIDDDMNEYNTTEDMTQNRSVWRMKAKHATWRRRDEYLQHNGRSLR